MLNIFFYISLRKFSLDIEKNLVTINLLWMIIFLLFKSFLFIHPSTNELAFANTFTNVIGAVFSLAGNNQSNLILTFINLFTKNINDNILALTYHSFLLLTFIFLSLIF